MIFNVLYNITFLAKNKGLSGFALIFLLFYDILNLKGCDLYD